MSLLNDLERLDIDAAELDVERAAKRQTGETIPVPDTQYDTDCCDVDGEGVGARFGTR